MSLEKEVVIVESPYGGLDSDVVARNVKYARACVSDAVHRGEIPLASHLLYTQPGILDDNIEAERNLGIDLGLAMGNMASKSVLYIDMGISRGMEYGIKNAENAGRPYEKRSLGEDWEIKYNSMVDNHSQRDVWEISCKKSE